MSLVPGILIHLETLILATVWVSYHPCDNPADPSVLEPVSYSGICGTQDEQLS